MRFKDFGDEPSFVKLSDGLVSVSSTKLSESEALLALELKNSEELSKWGERSKVINTEHHIFSIYYKDILVGQIILWDIEHNNTTTCSVSYWVDKDHHRKGIASKAIALVSNHAFSQLEIDSIEAHIQPENIASIELAKKLGFIFIGTKQKQLSATSGLKTHLTYALDK